MTATDHGRTPDQTAGVLKERLYVSIVGLSILLALREHSDHVEVGGTAAALTIGVLASVLAAVLAEVIAHVAAHRRPPSGAEVVHIVSSASWALLVLVVPLGLLGLAGADVVEPETGLTAAMWAMVLSLGFVTYASIRRSEISPVAKVGLLAGTVVFGAVVVGLQVLAHG